VVAVADGVPLRFGRPKPVVHPFGPGSLIAILVAATAPVSLAGPKAETHSPTLRAVASAATVCVTVVLPVSVTVSVTVVPARVALTLTVDPDTAVTDPDTRRPNPPPPGGLVPVGVGRPLREG
jgi:hypothetical protein